MLALGGQAIGGAFILLAALFTYWFGGRSERLKADIDVYQQIPLLTKGRAKLWEHIEDRVEKLGPKKRLARIAQGVGVILTTLAGIGLFFGGGAWATDQEQKARAAELQQFEDSFQQTREEIERAAQEQAAAVAKLQRRLEEMSQPQQLTQEELDAVRAGIEGFSRGLGN